MISVDGSATPCIACGKELEAPYDTNTPMGGLNFKTWGHYGSTVFDELDRTWLEINICDDCVTKAGKKGWVLRGVRVHSKPFAKHTKWEATDSD